MILDILIAVVLGICIFFPVLPNSMNTSIGKLLFLLFIYLILQQNILLGLIGGFIFMFYVFKPIESFFPKRKEKYSLLPLDETIRPKNSNQISVDRNSIAPPSQELSGSSPGGIFGNNTIGSYTQINI